MQDPAVTGVATLEEGTRVVTFIVTSIQPRDIFLYLFSRLNATQHKSLSLLEALPVTNHRPPGRLL